MQAARPQVALGGDFQRALDGQEATGPARFDRRRVKSLDPPGGVGVDRFGAASVEEVREVGGDRDRRLGPAPNHAQRLGDIMRIGVADQNGNDLERRRQHRLQHHEMHFERVLARKRPRVDENAASLGELGVSARRDRRLAERGQPFRRRMDREPMKRDPVRGTDDDDASRRLGAARPWAERSRGDRAGINDAGVRRDHELRRDAARQAARACACRRSAHSRIPAPPDRTFQRLGRDGFRLPAWRRPVDFLVNLALRTAPRQSSRA